MVIWLLGISGSGKTTLGKKLKKYLASQKIKNYIIDGDIVRDFFDNDLGYSKEDRILNIKRIMLSAYVLEQNDIIPIVCNISPFQHLRDLAKDKFNNYEEIYLKRTIDDIKNKDNIYQDINVVGVDLKFDIPKNPKLTIDTSALTIEKSYQKIITYLERKINEN